MTLTDTIRAEAIAHARRTFDDGHFLADLSALVGARTVSQGEADITALETYLRDLIAPRLARSGFSSRIAYLAGGAPLPFLIAERIENPALPTVLIYGHGDTVAGMEGEWENGRDPFQVTVEGDRWYGRGTADNKGQHLVNIAGLESALQARGDRLGFNVKFLIEMSEEIGSPGLKAFCAQERDALAADLFIASDGPRLSAGEATLFLGSRGAVNVDLAVNYRPRSYHSGNWGGLISNAATRLANALACLVGPHGELQVEALKAPPLTPDLKALLAKIGLTPAPGDPMIDPDWGEPDASSVERVFGLNTLEVLAYASGNAERPQNAIPGTAKATVQLRYVVGTPAQEIVPILRRHLDSRGFHEVEVTLARNEPMMATRLDPADPWVGFALASMAKTLGHEAALLPNLGGTIPNDVFSETLGLPTLWVPHSYPGCLQHGPDEHLLASVAREGVALMAGLFIDLGDEGTAIRNRRRTA